MSAAASSQDLSGVPHGVKCGIGDAGKLTLFDPSVIISRWRAQIQPYGWVSAGDGQSELDPFWPIRYRSTPQISRFARKAFGAGAGVSGNTNGAQGMMPCRVWIVLGIFALCGCAGPALRSQSPEDFDDDIESTTQLVGDVARPYGNNYVKVESVALVTGLAGTGEDPAPSPQRRDAAARDASPGRGAIPIRCWLSLERDGAGPRLFAAGSAKRRQLRSGSAGSFAQRDDQSARRLVDGNAADRIGRAGRPDPRRPFAGPGQGTDPGRSVGRSETNASCADHRPRAGRGHGAEVAIARPGVSNPERRGRSS